jgi:pimeloyl-ACP methyl ester carboxylesterase
MMGLRNEERSRAEAKVLRGVHSPVPELWKATEKLLRPSGASERREADRPSSTIMASAACVPASISCENAPPSFRSINGFVRLTRSGKTLNVHSAGSGPTLLFCHGLGSSLNFWGATADALALSSSHRLVRYDFDGAGSSPLSSPSLSIDSLAQDAIDLLDTLGIDKAVVIGHSMSGLVATTLASRFPDRVEKLSACPRPSPAMSASDAMQSSSAPSPRSPRPGRS